MDKVRALAKLLAAQGVAADRLLYDESMAQHTTFRVGGPAALFMEAASGAEVALALRLAEEEGVDALVLGNGSNVLCRDGGYDGLVVHIGEKMSDLRVDGDTLTCGAGCLMSRVASECLKRSLTGFEPLSGIPGTVGGAVAMNAGAYGGEIKDVLAGAEVFDGKSIRTLRRDEMQLSYRDTDILRNGWTVTSATFRLTPGDGAAIRGAMDDFAQRRRSKQPLSYPSAGSTFKRPAGYFAGALIQDCGCKGVKIGGAQVSTLHAGFIINIGGAVARDVLLLIELVQTKVRAAYGVELEPEVRIVGSDKR